MALNIYNDSFESYQFKAEYNCTESVTNFTITDLSPITDYSVDFYLFKSNYVSSKLNFINFQTG